MDETELLIRDLCARAPYNDTIVDVAYWVSYDGKPELEWSKEKLTLSLLHQIEEEEGAWGYIKPYLRPLSSMTEEEKKEYEKVCELDTEILAKHPMNGEPFPALYNSIDWLNKNHFDYRGLIEKGLAIEAPEGMYN